MITFNPRVLCLSVLLMTGVASAAEQAGAPDSRSPPTYGASVAYTFITACMQYAGDPTGLRAHLAAQGATQAPESEAPRYLHDRAGRVFGLRTPGGVQIFLSLDDGGCELIAPNVDERDFRAEFDKLLRALTILKSHEHEEPSQGLKHLDYDVREPAQAAGWRLVLSFPLPGRTGITSLTAYRLPNEK